jgi:hypothetical protein
MHRDKKLQRADLKSQILNLKYPICNLKEPNALCPLCVLCVSVVNRLLSHTQVEFELLLMYEAGQKEEGTSDGPVPSLI